MDRIEFLRDAYRIPLQVYGQNSGVLSMVKKWISENNIPKPEVLKVTGGIRIGPEQFLDSGFGLSINGQKAPPKKAVGIFPAGNEKKLNNWIEAYFNGEGIGNRDAAVLEIEGQDCNTPVPPALIRIELVVGSSMGGLSAAWAASRLRERPLKLVLLAPAFVIHESFERVLGAAGMGEWKRRGVRDHFHQGFGRNIELPYELWLETREQADRLVFADSLNPLRFNSVVVTEDERFEVLYVSDRGSGAKGNALWVPNVQENETVFRPIVRGFDDEMSVVENVGGGLLVVTDRGAHNRRLVQIDPERPAEEHWKVILPESRDPRPSPRRRCPR